MDNNADNNLIAPTNTLCIDGLDAEYERGTNIGATQSLKINSLDHPHHNATSWTSYSCVIPAIPPF